MFDTLEMSLTVLEQLAPLEPKLRQRRKSLADEVGRAAESIALNVSEARQRAGLDRADLFRRAAGSASELTTALRIARARGYITPADFAAVDAVLDRVRAMLWSMASQCTSCSDVQYLVDFDGDRMISSWPSLVMQR
jgi:four helix bundle protein